jgi:hypothetical protein
VICPECGAEYRPGFTECADCGVPLVDPPRRSDEKADGEQGPRPRDISPRGRLELVPLFTATNLAEVGLVKATLESAGIRFLTRSGGALRMGDGFGLPGLMETGVPGPVQFQVAREDADAARKLLEGLSSEQ